MSVYVKKQNKGTQAEELLRFYFLKAGYYVIRGIPYKYDGFDITDIDLFLYSKNSGVSREKVIVDIKNKRTPQALERIFWVKGLQAALKIDNAIVATTDVRPSVLKYGKEHNITVLNGSFLKKLEKLAQEYEYRLTDNEFLELIDEYSFQRMDGDWKNKITHAKSLLILGMNFDHINSWIDIASFFAQQVLTNPDYRKSALRCLYLICSFIFIGIDFQIRECLFMEQEEKKKYLNEGFTYGAKGEIGAKNTIDTALKLIRNTNQGSILANQILHDLTIGFRQLPSHILSEHFSKKEIFNHLFELALEFEKLAMNREFQHHSNQELNPLIKGTLFCLLDYWDISRLQFEELSKEI